MLIEHVVDPFKNLEMLIYVPMTMHIIYNVDRHATHAAVIRK